jgi:hypothetical protein
MRWVFREVEHLKKLLISGFLAPWPLDIAHFVESPFGSIDDNIVVTVI